MDWRCLNRFNKHYGSDFYLTALRYGHYLWLRFKCARALLSVDRALLSDLEGSEPVLRDWPLPYRAIQWLLQNHPADRFIGNPRVHYQHLADRMPEPRRLQRRWRAWAGWYIARQTMPELPADPKHTVEEPSREHIKENLKRYGIPGEAELWMETIVHSLNLFENKIKIVSGGQTGVDRAALDAAITCDAPYGGWCPRGRRAEGGSIPEHYDQLTEHESPRYKDRTLQNVIDSDATVIIYSVDLSGGTAVTHALCHQYHKPHLLMNAAEININEAAQQLRTFVQQHEVTTLNVAGPRASQWSQGYDYTKSLLTLLLTPQSPSKNDR